MTAPWERVQFRPTWGTHENNFSEQENKATQSGPIHTLPQDGKPKQSKDKENFGIINPLELFL